MTRFSKLTLRALAAVALVGAAAACGSTVDVDHYSSTEVRTVSGDSLFRGVSLYYSGLTDSATYVIRTNEQWRELWTRINANGAPVPPLPAVDFSRDMLLVVAMGLRFTGGYAVTIDHVTDTDAGTRLVESTLTHPANSCIVTEAFTAPFAAVLVPATSAPVRFVNHAAEHHCS